MAERAECAEVARRERRRVDASEVSWAVRELQRAQAEYDRHLACPSWLPPHSRRERSSARLRPSRRLQ